MMTIVANLLLILQILVALFLVFLVLLQRGKGGGLVGALGGMGGQSAFGPKADLHVIRLTIGVAIAWMVLICAGIFVNRSVSARTGGTSDNVPEMKADADVPVAPGEEAAGDDTTKPTTAAEPADTKPADKAPADETPEKADPEESTDKSKSKSAE